MNRQDNETIASNFFASYQSYWDRNYGVTDPAQQWMANSESLGVFQQTKLQPAEWNPQSISEIETILGTTIPADFVTFLCRHSFLTLECPLVSFASTTRSGFLRIAQQFAGCRMVPVGYSLDSAGCYLIDPHHNGAIVHRSFGESEHWDDRPLCISFAALIAILSELLDGKIRWYGPADSQRLAVIERAKSKDPMYFGGAAWEYWGPRLIETLADEVR